MVFVVLRQYMTIGGTNCVQSSMVKRNIMRGHGLYGRCDEGKSAALEYLLGQRLCVFL